jgi:uncharacterized protein involved in exopolysaccharide biosynthesis
VGMSGNLKNLTDAELLALFDEFESDERRLSARRSRLHQLIEYRKTTGSADGQPATAEELAELDAQERELSRERKELHRRIGEVRAERDARR